jgi:hypothetical protein
MLYLMKIRWAVCIYFILTRGPLWPWSYGMWIYNYLCNQCLSPLMLWVRISIRARCTTLCDKVCQWLATDGWFSPVSSTNKTDRHDITGILLKVALNTIKQTNNQTNILIHISAIQRIFFQRCFIILHRDIIQLEWEFGQVKLYQRK